MARISITDDDGGVVSIFKIDFHNNGLTPTEVAMGAKIYGGSVLVDDLGFARHELMLDIIEALTSIRERESKE